MLVAGWARALSMFLIPMITMRLVPREQQTRTIEMPLTSPVRESEIVLGKWLGAGPLFLLILATSVAAMLLRSRRLTPGWIAVSGAQVAIVPAGAVLAVHRGDRARDLRFLPAGSAQRRASGSRYGRPRGAPAGGLAAQAVKRNTLSPCRLKA